MVLHCAALELCPSDPKALFRRGLAYDQMDNCEKAYADMRAVQAIDPKNKEIQKYLIRLHKVVQDKVRKILLKYLKLFFH